MSGMDAKKKQQLKEKLKTELATLELELTDIGTINTADHHDWTGTAGSYKTGTADKNILADKIEEAQTNDHIVDELEARRASVVAALERIQKDKYGKCKECGIDIPMERLEANPAASACIEHAR